MAYSKQKRTYKGEALKYIEMDAEKFPADIDKAYKSYLVKRKAAADDKAVLEAKLRKLFKPNAGTEVLFGYNFGKISFALADEEKPKASGSKGKFDISQLLK